MNMIAFAVKDLKADSFFMPFYMETEAQAKRVLLTTALDADSALNRFPEDFALYKLGVQSFETGKYTEDIKQVATVSELLNAYQVHDDEENEYEEIE